MVEGHEGQGPALTDRLSRQLSLRPALESIGSGDVFRQVVSIVVQVLAILGVVGGVIALLRMTWDVLADEPTFTQGLSALLTLLFGVVALLIAAHIMWLRGNDVRRLEPAEFTVMPIAALLVRLYGEVVLAASLVLGVLAMLLTWLGWLGLMYEVAAMRRLVMVPGFDNAFFDGLAVLVGMWVWGFIVLLFSYLIAELIIVLFTIARNTDPARRGASQ